VPLGAIAADLVRPLLRDALRAGRALGPDAPPAVVHRARIRVKRLRYALETLRGLGGPAVRKTTVRLARLQERLGEHQDAVTHRTWLLAYAERPDVPAPTLVAVRAAAAPSSTSSPHGARAPCASRRPGREALGHPPRRRRGPRPGRRRRRAAADAARPHEDAGGGARDGRARDALRHAPHEPARSRGGDGGDRRRGVRRDAAAARARRARAGHAARRDASRAAPVPPPPARGARRARARALGARRAPPHGIARRARARLEEGRGRRARALRSAVLARRAPRGLHAARAPPRRSCDELVKIR